MDDNERMRLVGRARRVASLSSNDVHELKRIHSTGLRPFASELNAIMDRAGSDDDAVLLKASLKGLGSLSANERHRLDEAMNKRGRRIP